nr:ribonuclease H-like domain-containing protein [Tanacetum cinerariifolium]
MSSRDVRYFKNVFPFKIKQSSVEIVSQDLDHVNFLNEIIYGDLDTSYDDTNLNVQDQSDGSNSSQPSSPTIDQFKGDLGNPQGSNDSASENEMAATFDYETTLSEDVDSNIQTTEHVQNVNNQPFRRTYCLDLLFEIDLLACKPSAIPLEQNVSITSEPTNGDPIIDNITEYQKLIGKLIHLTHSRHDISYSVHCLRRGPSGTIMTMSVDVYPQWFTQHKINMDEAIQVSCIIDKLPPSSKDFKHTLKHKKEELTLVELGNHMCIKESLMVQDSDRIKSNNVVNPSVRISFHHIDTQK